MLFLRSLVVRVLARLLVLSAIDEATKIWRSWSSSNSYASSAARLVDPGSPHSTAFYSPRQAARFPGGSGRQCSWSRPRHCCAGTATSCDASELTRCLRTGRAKRRPRQRPERTGQLRDMVMLSQRPAEAADRAVPGHWEGDLILGRDGRSAVGTLVERTTRYVLLLHLPHGRDAHSVEQAMRRAIATLPSQLCRTITWD